MNVGISSVNFRSKKELAYIWLRDGIINGTLAAGSRLVIDDLATQLGVSQIPIREALTSLQAEGFVTFQPHVGATVTEIHPTLVNEIFGLLETTEVICGREACRQMDPEFLDEIEKMLREIDALVDRPDEFSKANAHFHQFICRQAGTLFLQKTVERVWLHWDRLRCSYLNAVFAQQTQIAQREHWELFNAFAAQDGDAVEEISRRHNRRAHQAYAGFMTEHPPGVSVS